MSSDSRLDCLACPRCHAEISISREAWACSRCAAPFPRRNGWTDFEPAAPRQTALAQRVMESRAVAGIYEGVFRPVLTRLGSHLGYAQEYAFLDQHLPSLSGPVLDLGCGTGRYAGWLARRGGAQNVIAIDVSAPMLDKAVDDARLRGWPGVLFLRASAAALPLKDNCLEAVTCFGALHLFPDPDRALASVARAMRPGATFVCMTTSRVSGLLQGSAQNMIRRNAGMRFFGGEELDLSLSRAGLVVSASRTSRMVMMIAAKKTTTSTG